MAGMQYIETAIGENDPAAHCTPVVQPWLKRRHINDLIGDIRM
jgi:hypothetical protein